MRLHRFSSFVVTSCFAIAALVTSSSAHAEAGRAPPRCEAFALPRYTSVVPSNVPALVAMPTAAAEGSQRVTLTSFTAIDGAATGTRFDDAFSRSPESRIPGATLFAPNAPLPADTTFEATFAVDCSGVDGTTTSRFVTAGPTDLPTTIGTLTTRAGSAPQGIEILVDATPEVIAFLPVTMLQIETRVGFVVVARYGEAQLSAEGGRLLVRTPPVFPLQLCEAGAVGSHVETMSLHAHVAGASSDPTPVSFDAAIACEPPKPSPSPTSAGETAGDSGDSGGCTTSPASPSRPVWATVALGAIALAASRRTLRKSAF